MNVQQMLNKYVYFSKVIGFSTYDFFFCITTQFEQNNV